MINCRFVYLTPSFAPKYFLSPAKGVVVVKMSPSGFFNINRFLIPTSALGFTKKKTNNSGHCATSGRILSAHRRTKLFPKERFGFLPS